MTLLHVPQQLRLQNKAEKDIDGKHKSEIGKIVPKRLSSVSNPIGTNRVNCFGKSENLKSKDD